AAGGLRFSGDFFEQSVATGREHDIRALAGQLLRGAATQSAGGAGNDEGLAEDGGAVHGVLRSGSAGRLRPPAWCASEVSFLKDSRASDNGAHGTATGRTRR